MNPRVAINDYNELLAVHRALLELKTITEPFDEAVIGSSIVAGFANRLLDAIIEMEKEKSGEEGARKWAAWRSIDESRREWTLIANQIAIIDDWDKMSLQQKREYVVNIASPFTLTVSQIDALINSEPADDV